MAVNVGQRNIKDTPSNRMLIALTKAQDLCTHTIKICSNENIFLPMYRQSLTDEIIKTSKDIFINAWKANNIFVTNQVEWQERSYYQRQAILECDSLLALMQLARTLFHLKGSKVQYWQTMCIDTKKYLNVWHLADIRRYKDFGM